MTEEHTELLEVGIGQLRQDFRVDRVVAKCLLVLLEPEASQPSGNVHTSSPKAEFGSLSCNINSDAREML